MLRRLLLLGALAGLTGCDTYAVTDGDCPAGEVLSATGCAIPCVGDGSCADGTICLDGSCAEGVRPAVTTYSPLDGADAVAVDAEVVVTFSIPMEPLSATGAFSLTRNSVVQAGAVNWSAGNLTLTFTPAADLSAGVTYVAEIGTEALSADGVPLASTFRTTFTTDAPPVAVLSMDPVPGSTDVGVRPQISLTFSIAMEPVTTTQAFSLTDVAGSPVGGNATLDPLGTTLTFAPGPALANAEEYTVAVATTAVSLIGVPLDQAFEAIFTTTNEVDALPPTVSIDPIGVAVMSSNDLTPTSSFVFTGTATDAESSIDHAFAQVAPAGTGASGTWAPTVIMTPGSNVTWTFDWYPRQSGATLDGAFTLYVRAVDKGGNSQETSLTFLVDFIPPPTPSWVTQPPTDWKFLSLDLNVSGEANNFLDVLVNSVRTPESPIPLGPAGVATVPVTLPSLGNHTISINTVDAVGNASAPGLYAVIERIELSCLTASSFPAPGYTLLDYTLDADTGYAEVRYEFDAVMMPDTYISSTQPTSNFGTDAELRISADEHILMTLFWDIVPYCADMAVADLILFEVSDFEATDDIDVYTTAMSYTEALANWQTPGSMAWQTPGGYTPGSTNHFFVATISHTAGATAQDDVAVVDMRAEFLMAYGIDYGYIFVPGGDGASAVFSSSDAASNRPQLHMILQERP